MDGGVDIGALLCRLLLRTPRRLSKSTMYGNPKLDRTRKGLYLDFTALANLSLMYNDSVSALIKESQLNIQFMIRIGKQ